MRRRRPALVLLCVFGAVMLAAWLGSGFAAPRSGPLLAQAAKAGIPVDVELVLAVDISYSMDPDEQALQREGYIDGPHLGRFLRALRDGIHGKVAVTYFEWAGAVDQKIVVPWRVIDGPEAADAFAAEIDERAVSPCVAHLDFRRADVCRAVVRGAAAIAACAASSTSPATAPTTTDRWSRSRATR